MNNLLTASLAITLGGTSVLAGASPPMEQSPGVPTPGAVVHKENAEADNGAGPNSSARVHGAEIGWRSVRSHLKTKSGQSEQPFGSCFIMASVPRKTRGRSQRCCDLKKWMRSWHL